MEYKIQHDENSARFETTVENSSAYLEYVLQGELMNIMHTLVPKPIEGRGVAAALVKAALEYAREKGLKVLPSCWYAELYLRRHPEYAGLSAL